MLKLNNLKLIAVSLLIVFVLNVKLNAQNIDACKSNIKVGITGFFSDEPGKKPKRHSDENVVNSMTKSLADALSKGTKVKASPVFDFSQERDLMEKSATGSDADLLLYMEMKTKGDWNLGINIPCGVFLRTLCKAKEVEFILNYKVFDSGDGKILKTGAISGKHSDANLAAEKIANQLNEEVGNLARKEKY